MSSGDKQRQQKADDKVRIWSGEHRAWWRPDGCGYTPHMIEAGIYTRWDAERRTKHCDPSKMIEIQDADKAPQSSCAAQEPIPEHYSLDEVAARTLRDWLNDGDGGLNDVTIHVGRGHGGPGLYVSLTEYPEEGAALLVEAPQNESRSAAAKPSAGTGS